MGLGRTCVAGYVWFGSCFCGLLAFYGVSGGFDLVGVGEFFAG